MGLWETEAGSRWNWKPLVCDLHTGSSGVMIPGSGTGMEDPSDSFQSDCAALFRIHTAQLA